MIKRFLIDPFAVIFNQPMTKISTWLVLTSVYTVIGLFILVQQNLKNMIDVWGQAAQFHVYMHDEATDQQTATVQKAIEGLPNLESVNFVSKESALQQFKQKMAGYVPDSLFDKDLGNPLPSSFEVSFRSSVSADQLSQYLSTIASSFAAMGGVEDISFGQEWVKNYSKFVRMFSTFSLIFMIILAAGSLLVVGNSIRSSIHQRRHEIEIFELLGATRTYIRAPYVREGVLWGLIASVTAISICFAIFQTQNVLITRFIGTLSTGVDVHFFSLSAIATLLALGPVIGYVGSYLSVREISTGWSAAAQEQRR